MKKHIIDLDTNPLVPQFEQLAVCLNIKEVWSVHEHRRGGQFVWNPRKVALYLSPHQHGADAAIGRKIRRKLQHQPVLNANLLDYLLAHKRLIPKDWKDKMVFFWGTLYRQSSGRICVRCLDWTKKFGWEWTCRQVNSDIFYSCSRAAVLVNN